MENTLHYRFKMPKRLVHLLLLTFFSLSVWAKPSYDPTHWTYEIQKSPKGAYFEIIFTAQIDSGWHLWAQDAGGDGSLIPTSIQFNDASKKMLKGVLQEQGDLIKVHSEIFESTVNYFEKQVQFSQVIQGKKGDIISGAIEYQNCSETICLPPKTHHFTLTIP